ncbi:MAG: glucose 1-dehydrogenase [Chloroflexota bacterium]|nr:glucose 1-dehydrogenase [Chloroflexota bacterium]
MTDRLKGKVALITGGASGIGAESARFMAREGARVAIADVNEKLGEEVVSDIRKAGGEAFFLRLDVTKEAEWERAIAAVEARYGVLNVLFNNAGITVRKLVENADLESWQRIMDVNITGVFLGTKHVIPAMRRAGGGSIINMSSAHALVGDSAGHPAYFASKAGVRLLTKATAIQHAKDNIRANSVHPGFVETPMTAAFHASGAAEVRKARTPLGRLAMPADIAWGVLFLASDEASFMTGSELVIDGGLTAQ